VHRGAIDGKKRRRSAQNEARLCLEEETCHTSHASTLSALILKRFERRRAPLGQEIINSLLETGDGIGAAPVPG
jgi:hypothetical protein